MCIHKALLQNMYYKNWNLRHTYWASSQVAVKKVKHRYHKEIQLIRVMAWKPGPYFLSHHLKKLFQPELYTKTQSVPRSKHSVSAIKTSQLMLYREIIAVCSEIHTKHINTVCVCGQNVELLNVKLVVYIVTTGLYRANY